MIAGDEDDEIGGGHDYEHPVREAHRHHHGRHLGDDQDDEENRPGNRADSVVADVLGIGQHQADIGQHTEQAQRHRGSWEPRWRLHPDGGIGHASSQADARRRGVRLRLRTHHL